MCVCVCVCVYIQGVSRLVDVTAEGDFLGLCDQKSSYKHVSDFGRLRSYGHFFNSRTRPHVNRVTEPDGGSCPQLSGLPFVLRALFCHLTRPPSRKQSSFRITSLRWYLRNAG